MTNSQKNILLNPLSEIKTPMPDFGKDDAFLALAFGALSIILSPLCSILCFIFAKQYKLKGDGRNKKKVIAGKILSISSFVIAFAFFAVQIFSLSYIFAVIFSL